MAEPLGLPFHRADPHAAPHADTLAVAYTTIRAVVFADVGAIACGPGRRTLSRAVARAVACVIVRAVPRANLRAVPRTNILAVACIIVRALSAYVGAFTCALGRAP